MSGGFGEYKENASTYTALRRPLGSDKVARFLAPADGPVQGNGVPGVNLSSLKLLDSGCGTGNYTVEFVKKYGLRRVHCSDYSEAMLGEARKNMERLLQNDEKPKVAPEIAYSSDDVTNMDRERFPDGSFDAVINNQVVHHLRPQDEFKDLKLACKEWFRVLKPGGKLSINWCQPLQVQIAMWWGELIPKALAEWQTRGPTLAMMRTALLEAGFKEADVSFSPAFDEILYDPKTYYDLELFEKNTAFFARSDSTFNLCALGELEEASNKVKRMREEGTLKAWLERKECERQQIGQTMFAFAVKE